MAIVVKSMATSGVDGLKQGGEYGTIDRIGQDNNIISPR